MQREATKLLALTKFSGVIINYSESRPNAAYTLTEIWSQIMVPVAANLKCIFLRKFYGYEKNWSATSNSLNGVDFKFAASGTIILVHISVNVYAALNRICLILPIPYHYFVIVDLNI